MSVDTLFGPEKAIRAPEGIRRAEGGSDIWLTPPGILEALGPFDLDPCAAPEPRPWPTAREHYTAEVDGLRQEWRGRVWMNPPYSDMRVWMARLADHGTGTALIFARTETGWFREFVWGRATALRFLSGRLRFHRWDGAVSTENAGGPSVLVAYGAGDAARLHDCRLGGAYVQDWRSEEAS